MYGLCAPGEMLALLGSSGSGKSMFLDMLSGRKSLGMMTGCTTLNGEAVSGTGMRRLASYVVQVRQGGLNGVIEGRLGLWEGSVRHSGHTTEAQGGQARALRVQVRAQGGQARALRVQVRA